MEARLANPAWRVEITGVAALPAILVLDNNQTCVLVGWADSGDARVLLPQTGQGEITLPRANLAERYSSITLFVRPQFRFDGRTREVRAGSKRGHWFWSAIGAQRFVYRDVLWAAALAGVVGALGMVVVRRLTRRRG